MAIPVIFLLLLGHATSQSITKGPPNESQRMLKLIQGTASIPSNVPSRIPSNDSKWQSKLRSQIPSDEPSMVPSDQPSLIPSDQPSLIPSDQPSSLPSAMDFVQQARISEQEVLSVIINNAIFGGSEFEEGNSYQQQALTWVLAQTLPTPGVQGTMEEQALQLYALACIFWATFVVPNQWTDLYFGPDAALPWTSMGGWMGDPGAVCSWYGVTCDDQDKVIGLELSTNGLSGMFPPEVVLLADSLRYLDLYNNLVHNSGDEGNAFLGQLTNLEFLYYGSTFFEYDGIPTEIGLLTNLKEYDFSYTLYYGGIPPGMWSSLSGLEYLVMDGNGYNSSFPDDLVTLPNLQYVYAANTFLEGDLEFVSVMPSIYELWIDNNPELTGTIPSALSAATALVSFSVTGCDLFGTIPTEIGLMAQMVQMWLTDNRLSGPIPSELGSIVSLEELQLAVNQLTGEVPSDICSSFTPFGRLQSIGADCDDAIGCTCCTCCGIDCLS